MAGRYPAAISAGMAAGAPSRSSTDTGQASLVDRIPNGFAPDFSRAWRHYPVSHRFTSLDFHANELTLTRAAGEIYGTRRSGGAPTSAGCRAPRRG
jgi:hypothetical protein